MRGRSWRGRYEHSLLFKVSTLDVHIRSIDGPLRVWGTSLAAFQKSFHFAALPIWRDVLRSACKNARSAVHFCRPAAFAYKQELKAVLIHIDRVWTSKPRAGERKRAGHLSDMKNGIFHSGLLLYLWEQRPSEHPLCRRDAKALFSWLT